MISQHRTVPPRSSDIPTTAQWRDRDKAETYEASGHGSGDERLGPVREAVVSCANRGQVPVVLEGEEFHRPTMAMPRKDGIARVWRTQFDAVGSRDIGEHRTTDRPRIHNQRSARHLCQTLTVTVPAQHDRAGHCCTEAFTDLLTRRRNQSVLMDFLGQERAVVRRCAVHCQNSLREFDECRQRVLHVALFGRERRMRKPIRRGEARLVAIQQPAVVIPTHRWQPQCGKKFGGFARPERTRNVIAEVDGRINAAAANIRDCRFKREQIGMDVGNDS